MKTSMTWEEICADPDLRKLPHKIEQDRFGRILMTPPPGFPHGRFQMEVGLRLKQLLPDWEVTGECPVQTEEGVRAPDVAALRRSGPRRHAAEQGVLARAPAICVEILSPANSEAEMDEKRRLLFQVGCEEFWTCSEQGRMSFHSRDGSKLQHSRLCPEFPGSIALD